MENTKDGYLDPVLQELESLWDDPRPYPCVPDPGYETYAAMDDVDVLTGAIEGTCVDARWKVDDLNHEFEILRFIKRNESGS